jgi:hypothetical protein
MPARLRCVNVCSPRAYGEAPEGKGNYKDHIVNRGDLSVEGSRNKARWVLDEMENRMRALGFNWSDATASQLYTVHNIYPFMAEEIGRRGAMHGGLTWHLNRPPVVELEYEMDCRCMHFERVLAVRCAQSPAFPIEKHKWFCRIKRISKN